MAKKRSGPPSKRDGDNACGALHYGIDILNHVSNFNEVEQKGDDFFQIPPDQIPIMIRIHTRADDGVVDLIRVAPILNCSIVNGAICLGTYEHLLVRER